MLTRMPYAYRMYLEGVGKESFIYKDTAQLLLDLKENPDY